MKKLAIPTPADHKKTGGRMTSSPKNAETKMVISMPCRETNRLPLASMEELGYSARQTLQLEQILRRNSGLFGLAGLSGSTGACKSFSLNEVMQ